LSFILAWSFSQIWFDDFAKDVQQELVRFLDSRCGIASHDEIDIGNISARSAVAAEQGDSFQFSRFPFLEGSPNVRRFSARGDGDEDVTRLSKGGHLSRKNFFKTIIISRGRDEAAALRQVHGRIWPPVLHKATGELSAKIGRVRRAASIPAGEEFIPSAQTFCDEIRRFGHDRLEFA